MFANCEIEYATVCKHCKLWRVTKCNALLNMCNNLEGYIIY